MLARRAGLSTEQRAERSARIARRLLDLPELRTTGTVIGYAAGGTEADLDTVLQALMEAGREVLLPYVEGPELGVARVRDLGAGLAAGYRGIREPIPVGRIAADLAGCVLALVPGVAFDRRGGRLGYGGGHFDRLLSRLPPDTTIVGVAFGLQVVDHVPREDHDIAVDMLVTEEEVLRVVG